MTNETKPELTEEFKPENAAGPRSETEATPKSEASAEPKKMLTKQRKKWLVAAVVVLIVIGLGVAVWQRFGRVDKNKGLAGGNGRIESVEIDVSAKAPGRVKDILVHEGELVTAGQVVALMDTEVLGAEHRQAEAQLKQAESGVETARSQLVQRGSEKEAALALVG